MDAATATADADRSIQNGYNDTRPSKSVRCTVLYLHHVGILHLFPPKATFNSLNTNG